LGPLNRKIAARSFVEGGDVGWKRIIHPGDYPDLARTLRHSLHTGEPFDGDYRVLRVPGGYRSTRLLVRPILHSDGHPIGWFGTALDGNCSEANDTAQPQREQHLQRVVDSVPIHIWSADPDGNALYVNHRYRTFLGLLNGYPEPFCLADTKAMSSYIHPEDQPRTAAAFRASLVTGSPYRQRYRQRGPDNVYRWKEGRAEALRDANGMIVEWYGVSLDVDEQVRSEQALRDSERTLRQLVETLPAMIDCATPDGEPIYRSRQLREYLGYNLEELDNLGKPRLAGTLDAGVHPDDVDGVKRHYALSLATGTSYRRRHRLRRFDGEYRWVETRAAPMRDADGQIVQWNVICLDIDAEVKVQVDLRLAHDQLARASQAASLAELSASIAHEVSQPLVAVVANAQASQQWLAIDPPNIERARLSVERTLRDANSVSDVVNRIRALFRRSSDKLVETTLAGIVREARELMAEEALRRGVRLEFNVESNLPSVMVDRVQIQQVLVNLIRNGMEAMETAPGDRILRLHARYSGEATRVEVSDTGAGITVPERIFEPFYSTKDEGMGMGLAISRSIVEAHGGRLWAEEGQQSGARFIFTLPGTA
jgi:PAS domain S-box-containing protein